MAHVDHYPGTSNAGGPWSALKPGGVAPPGAYDSILKEMNHKAQTLATFRSAPATPSAQTLFGEPVRDAGRLVPDVSFGDMRIAGPEPVGIKVRRASAVCGGAVGHTRAPMPIVGNEWAQM